MNDTSAGRLPHHDVAAYALGLLEDDDATAFEQHLAFCGNCAEELESFLPVVALLPDGRLSAADMTDDLPDDLKARRMRRPTSRPLRRSPLAGSAGAAGRLVGAARAGLRRPAIAAAAAAVAAAGVTIAAVETLGTLEPRERTARAVATGAAPAPWSQLSGPDLATGRHLEADDARSGVHAEAVLDRAPWGTRVSLALWQLIGPQECRLVVVRRGGGGQVVSSWSVPRQGFGRGEHQQPLVLQAATSIPPDEIQAVVVEAVGDEATAPLVRLAP